MVEQKKTDKTDAEVQKEVEEKTRRLKLLSQSLLMLNIEELVKLNRTKFAPDGYESFLCVEDDDPGTFTSKIMGFDFRPIDNLKTSHFSSLVPSIRFYKVTYDVNNKKHKASGRREITFPTSMTSDVDKRYKNRLIFEPSDKPNIGLRNVEWRFMGGNAYREKNLLDVTLQLYAERMSDFFSDVPGDKEANYSDLFNHSDRYLPSMNSEDKDDKNERDLNEQYYTIEMEVGWSVPKNMVENQSLNTDAATTALDIIREQKTTIHLNVTKMDLDIQQNGSVGMTISYVGHMQKLLDHPETNAIFDGLDQKKIKEEIKKIREKIDGTQRAQGAVKDTFKKIAGGKLDDLPPEEKKIYDKNNAVFKEQISQMNGDLKNLQIDVNQRLSIIIKNLLEEKRVRVFSFKEKRLLAALNPEADMGSYLDDSMQIVNPECFNLEGVADGYEAIGVLDVPPTSILATPAPTENPSSQAQQSSIDGPSANSALSYDAEKAGGKLKMMKHKKTGKFAYYFYPPGSTTFSPVTIGRRRVNMIMHEDLPETLDSYTGGGTIIEAQKEVQKARGQSSICNVDTLENTLDEKSQKALNEMMNKNVITSLDDKTIISDYFKKFSAPTFDKKPGQEHGTYSIKYFYYGDLLDVVFRLFYSKYEESGDGPNLRPIVGPVAINNYAVKEIDLLSKMETSGNSLMQLELASGDQISTNEKRRKIKEVSTKIERKEHAVNMADIPISLDSFINWFNSTYIKKGAFNFSFDNFLRQTFSLVNKVATARDKTQLSIVPTQNISPQYQYAVVKTKKTGNDEAGTDYFGFSNKKGKKVPHFSHAHGGRRRLDKITKKNGSEDPVSLRQSGDMVFHETELLDQDKKVKVINYFILSSRGHSVLDREGDYEKDSKEGIPHFFVGADSGLVKSINFSLQENQALLNDAYLNTASSEGPRLPIRGTFQVNITMFGNVFMAPHSYVYVNPLALGLGNEKSPTSKRIDKLLGISGYYAVTKIENYIQAGTYETKIVARYIGPKKPNQTHGNTPKDRFGLPIRKPTMMVFGGGE